MIAGINGNNNGNNNCGDGDNGNINGNNNDGMYEDALLYTSKSLMNWRLRLLLTIYQHWITNITGVERNLLAVFDIIL